MINHSIFRKYDIRGIVGTEMTMNDVDLISKAIATEFVNRGISKISLGYDGRNSSVEIFNIVSKNLIKSGISIVNIGLVPSPCLYFSVYTLDVQAGVMITASHNPKEYNGFKIMMKGSCFFDQDIEKLYEICVSDEFKSHGTAGIIQNIDISDKYVEKITEFISKDTKLNICIDSGNGAAGEIVKKIAKNIEIPENNLLYCDIDGNFPNHHADPTVEKNMKDLSVFVIKNNCSVGIGFDGDGDRIGIVDDLGRFVSGDILLCILSKFVLQENSGAKVIADVKTSKVFFDEIIKLGGIPIMYKTGHSFIKNKMNEENAILAGEMSGHIFYKDRYFGFDDGLYAAMRLVEIIQKNDIKLSELIDSYPKTFNTPEIKITVSEERKFKIMSEIIEVLKQKYSDYSDLDGMRVNFDCGWFLIRASNTQNCLVVRFEADSEENLNHLKGILNNILQKFNLDI